MPLPLQSRKPGEKSHIVEEGSLLLTHWGGTQSHSHTLEILGPKHVIFQQFDVSIRQQSRRNTCGKQEMHAVFVQNPKTGYSARLKKINTCLDGLTGCGNR